MKIHEEKNNINMKKESDLAKPFFCNQDNTKDTMSDGSSTSPHGITPRLVLVVMISLLGSSLPCGYCLGVINTPHEIIRQWVKSAVLEAYSHELSEKGEVYVWAMVVSLFVFGAIMGASVGGRFTDTLGRRTALLMNHLLCIFSAVLYMFCKMMGSVEMLMIGRFTSGLYTGLATCIVPTYLSEVAPAELTGVMGVVFPLGMCIGLLLSLILGLDIILGTEDCWPFLLGAFGVLVVLAVIGHPLLPESPIFCYTVRQDEVRGLKALQCLRGKDSKAVEVENSALKRLAHQVKETNCNNTWSVMRLLHSNKYRMFLLLAVLANAAQQFSGINAVFFYSTLIFHSAGLDLYQSQGASIGCGAINTLCALLAIPLVKHCRRRVLFLSSMVLCVLCQCVLVVVLHYLPFYTWASYCAILSLMLYVIAYGIGLGPIPFMIATELFPAGPRSVGIAMGGTTNWLSSMVVGLTFPVIQSEIGEFAFLLFIASSCMFGVFMYKFLPETFGGVILNSSKEEMNSSGASKKTSTDESEVDSLNMV